MTSRYDSFWRLKLGMPARTVSEAVIHPNRAPSLDATAAPAPPQLPSGCNIELGAIAASLAHDPLRPPRRSIGASLYDAR
jgi:hypothetical protein